MVIERRKFPRAELKYKITVVCDGTVILGAPSDYTFHTHSENISVGGLKVILDRQLPVGTLVQLEVFVTPNAPIVCKGIIVWTQRINPQETKPDLFETGIQFIELDDMGQSIIANVIAKITPKPSDAQSA
ncbi:MAG TPA: PilZ domain-containing protein [Candidatus Omnitrophota bacterium]|nr:PilZ domain-containing protein [Candidatus Omnitrophota bacterium]HNX82465.1 PilZ domain-containing protein [Candidatus Omnitrophota bacterium]HPT06966.1 PilZ domain-containing protein [Candidatus Omnitrophota bacterium]